MTKLQKIVYPLCIALIIFLGGTIFSQRFESSKPHSVTFGTTLPVAGSTYFISGSGIAPGDTSITLQSFTIPQTGQKIQPTDLSPTFFFTLEPGNNTKQEIISCTSEVQNQTGTATLNGCSRGLSPISPYTASTTLAFAHAGGSSVIMSDAPQLFNLYAAKSNNELITGQWTASSTNPIAYDQVWPITSSSTSVQIPYVSWIFNNFLDLYDAQTISGIKNFTALPTTSVAPTGGTQLVNKTYADGLAIAGAPNASLIQKGIVQEATIAQMNSKSDTGSTGAKLFFTPQDFSNSNFASTTLSLATSTTDYKIFTLSAGQRLMIWGVTTNGGVNATLSFRFATDLATTTLMSVSGSGGGSNQQTVPTFGLVVATSTSNTVAVGLSGGAPDYMMTLITN